jgi:hypothetical protein
MPCDKNSVGSPKAEKRKHPWNVLSLLGGYFLCEEKRCQEPFRLFIVEKRS